MLLVEDSTLELKYSYQLIVKLKAIQVLYKIALLFIFLH